MVEQGRLRRTEDGVPQGGVVSPLLLNVALHGMEMAAGVRYYQTGNSAGKAVMGSPVLIRYADDFVALCHTRQEALEIKARLAKWLAPRGLAFNEDKTRVVSLAEGFDFLGFNVRRYRGKLLIKPSKAAIRRIRERLRSELRALRDHSAKAVIRRLNPIIRGWANYYRTHVAAEIFAKLDQYLWRLTYKWARFSHANKSASWVTARYFGKFNKARQDRWVRRVIHPIRQVSRQRQVTLDHLTVTRATVSSQRRPDSKRAGSARVLRRQEPKVRARIVGRRQVSRTDVHRPGQPTRLPDEREPAVVRDVQPLVPIGDHRVRPLDPLGQSSRDRSEAGEQSERAVNVQPGPAALAQVRDLAYRIEVARVHLTGVGDHNRRPVGSGSRGGYPPRLPQNRTYAVRIRLLGTAGCYPRRRPVCDLEVIPIAPTVARRGRRCAGAPDGAGRRQTQARA